MGSRPTRGTQRDSPPRGAGPVAEKAEEMKTAGPFDPGRAAEFQFPALICERLSSGFGLIVGWLFANFLRWTQVPKPSVGEAAPDGGRAEVGTLIIAACGR